MASAYEVANPDQVRERGPKQKRRKGIDIIPPIESERGPSPVFCLPMEGESLESEFEELQGEILGSLNAWMDKEAKEKEALQNCTMEEGGHFYKKR